MKLSVVIVNYNVKYFLELCLYSLYRAINGVPTEIFVVDNASEDGSVEYLKVRFPEVIFISNKENYGFSRANNQAIELAKGEYILVLNPDTVLGENVVKDCISFMDANPQTGGAGVRMITGNGSFLPESKRGFPDPLSSFYKFAGLSTLFPYSHRFGKYHLRFLNNNKSHSVDVLAGAYMLLRKETLQKSGSFDEDFFMYGEDIDLSYRIKKAGYENYYLPYSIIHYKGESTKKDSFKYVFTFYEAMIIFFKKHYPNYSNGLSFVIKVGIYLKALIAILNRVPKRLSNFSKKKHSASELCFLVLGSKKMIYEVKAICRKNGLEGAHRFFIADEKSRPEGHLGVHHWGMKFSHIIYDSDVYSYENIFHLISSSEKNVELGLYSVHNGILVTPKKCYQ